MINFLKLVASENLHDDCIDTVDNKEDNTLKRIWRCSHNLFIIPVEQRRNPKIGMLAISLIGEGKVRPNTTKAIPAFWMAVSREMAMIWNAYS